MEDRRPEKIKRDARTRVVLSAIFVSLFPRTGRGWGGLGGGRGGLERGMDFMPRARYMAAATPGQK